MPRSFNAWPPNNPRALIRLGLGALAVANLAALYFVIRPIGGSAQELRQQALDMHSANPAAARRAGPDAAAWPARLKAAAAKAIGS